MSPDEFQTYVTDRFKAGDERMNDLQSQIDGLQKQNTELKQDVAENTELTKSIATHTAGIIETFEALRGGFKVLEGLGRFARPVGYILAALAAGLAHMRFAAFAPGLHCLHLRFPMRHRL